MDNVSGGSMRVKIAVKMLEVNVKERNERKRREKERKGEDSEFD